MLVDTHFHLDLMPNMHALITELDEPTLGVIAVGTTPKAYDRENAFVNESGGIRVSLGMHPQLVEDRRVELDLMLQLVSNALYVGEVGLDFGRQFSSSRQEQLLCFREIAEACAMYGGKTLSIHSVRAATTVIEELEASGTFRTCRCILHWFTGTESQRKRAIVDGAYFSINPRMLRTQSGRETIRSVPADRLLLETDAPFVGHIESTSDLLVELRRVVDEVSLIRGMDMSGIIEDNSMRVWLGM